MTQGGTLRVLRAETWLTVYLPHDCHNTETIAKPARLGPAKNDTTLVEISRVDKVLLDDLQENTENLVERISNINMDVIKHRKRNTLSMSMIFQNFGKFRENFEEKHANMKILNF